MHQTRAHLEPFSAAGLLDLCYEEEIKSVADAMVANGMRDLGYDLIFLGAC